MVPSSASRTIRSQLQKPLVLSYTVTFPARSTSIRPFPWVQIHRCSRESEKMQRMRTPDSLSVRVFVVRAPVVRSTISRPRSPAMHSSFCHTVTPFVTYFSMAAEA